MSDNAPPQGVELARDYSVEYLCSDGRWYVGKASGPNEQAAIDECRTRWKEGALGVRVVERRKTVIQQRVRGEG